MCLGFCVTCVWNIIISRNERGIVISVRRSSCEVPAVLVRFQCNWYIANRFSKGARISNFKVFAIVAELFHENRQTDRHDEDNNLFSQFCESA